MELVDRYLHSVKFWLPRNQKDDIIADLSEDICSQIEDKEGELGRKLTDSEVEPILKRCGAPMAVAGRYLPQQSLIGPALFPIYRVIIRSLILYFLLPWMLVWMGIAIFSPDFRADHPGAALFLSLGPWWRACIYSLFFNTLIFALLDRSQARLHLVNDWNPRSLPAVRDRNVISRGGTIFELTVVVATLAAWIQLDTFRRVFHVFGTTITLSSRWPYFFWALVVVTLAGIVVSSMNLSNPALDAPQRQPPPRHRLLFFWTVLLAMPGRDAAFDQRQQPLFFRRRRFCQILQSLDGQLGYLGAGNRCDSHLLQRPPCPPRGPSSVRCLSVGTFGLGGPASQV